MFPSLFPITNKIIKSYLYALLLIYVHAYNKYYLYVEPKYFIFLILYLNCYYILILSFRHLCCLEVNFQRFSSYLRKGTHLISENTFGNEIKSLYISKNDPLFTIVISSLLCSKYPRIYIELRNRKT